MSSVSGFINNMFYGTSIVRKGIESSPVSTLVNCAATQILGTVATAALVSTAMESKSKSTRVIFGLAAAGAFGLTMYAAATSADGFLKTGCMEIFKQFGSSIPSYSPCRQMICTVTLRLR